MQRSESSTTGASLSATKVAARSKAAVTNLSPSSAAGPATTNATPKAANGPVMPTRVVIKLILFSMLLFVVPFSTYFLTLHHLFPGNMTYSAFAAAISANVVLLGYVIVAVTEGDPTPDTDTTAKKTQ